MNKTILILGAFDTKGEEYAFIKRLIETRGHNTLTLHTGVFEATRWIQPDISTAEVAQAGGVDIRELQEKKDRGLAMRVMSQGVEMDANINGPVFADKAADMLLKMIAAA